MTHISVYIMGGLGNQLFQIFTVISISIEQNIQMVFPYSEFSHSMTKRDTYWNNLLSNLLQFTTKKSKLSIQDINNFFVLREKQHSFVSIPKILNNTMLFGYFQSYKYFNNNKKQIIELLDIENIKNKLNNKYDYYDTVSLHFRLGDYKDLQQHHPILPIDYYIKSLKQLIEDTKKMIGKYYIFMKKMILILF